MNISKKICLVAASPGTIKAFLVPHIIQLSKDYNVTVVCNGLPDSWSQIPARFHPLAIERKVSVLSDIIALVALIIFFRRERFDLVHSYTPKAGLLAMTAAWVNRVPIRIHTYTGQVWANRKGVHRAFLAGFDRIISACATDVLADSRSQLRFLEESSIVRNGRGRVVANGSVSGVDLSRFRSDDNVRHIVRSEFCVPLESIVFIFVGRINRDKGILDLASAFSQLVTVHSNTYLMLVGPDEEDLIPEVSKTLGNCANRILVIGPTSIPERFMQSADIICLPSYREGFGSVLIEGAAIGLPSVASRIYGITDAVQDQVTGLLHTPGDVLALTAAMFRLHDDHEFRERVAKRARLYAFENFEQKYVVDALMNYYKEFFARRATRPA